jgi:pimeloyl-ACP methyl ester carboxylesterase
MSQRHVVARASMKETPAVQPPDVSYARSGEVAIAYQVVGAGSTDVVFVRGITGDLLSTWEQPLLVRHVEDIAAYARVLMLDKRGTGLSDRVREVQSLETTMDDVRAVMDAAGSERAMLWTAAASTGIGVLFAATYPERCAGLVLFDPRPKGTRSPDSRGPRPRRNGGNGSPTCAPGGENAGTSRASRANGRRRWQRTTTFASGSSGTCAAASVQALP